MSPARKMESVSQPSATDSSFVSPTEDELRLALEALSAGKMTPKLIRLLDDIVIHEPARLANVVDRFVQAMLGEHPKSANVSARILPELARTAPARVAKHLAMLTDSVTGESNEVQDGLVRIFTALAVASITYHRRLVESFAKALEHAEPKQFVMWAQLVLPVLKSEPYADVRTLVENRLPTLPAPFAQKLADFLGIKLRKPRP